MSRIEPRRRLSGRPWLAELVIRAGGLAVLGLCATAARGLYLSGNLPPRHGATALEFLFAALAFLAWACGWAMTIEGMGIFEKIEVPGRRRFAVV